MVSIQHLAVGQKDREVGIPKGFETRRLALAGGLDGYGILRAPEDSYRSWRGHVGIQDTEAAAAGHGGCRDRPRRSPRCWLPRTARSAVWSRCVSVLCGCGRGMLSPPAALVGEVGERSAAVWLHAVRLYSCSFALDVASSIPSRMRRSESSLLTSSLSRPNWSSFGCR